MRNWLFFLMVGAMSEITVITSMLDFINETKRPPPPLVDALSSQRLQSSRMDIRGEGKIHHRPARIERAAED